MNTAKRTRKEHQKAIRQILKENFLSCDPEECWNACGETDKYGYVDVAIVFSLNDKTRQIFGNLVNEDDEDVCWLWACFKGKNRCNSYFLTGQESAPRLDGRSNLAQMVRHMFDSKILSSRRKFIKALELERKED